MINEESSDNVEISPKVSPPLNFEQKIVHSRPISGTEFPPEVPKSFDSKKKSQKDHRVGKIVFWVIVIGIIIPLIPFILIAVVCTAGAGLIPLGGVGFLVYLFYKWLFKE
ncbi:hypothetical protein HN789_05720 [archaeon]|jgi:hypothetical protein|nr:hypothetical protein [archaeon]MBT4023012.1 hypothetical protein [archaeon]MBT4272003.1 hypothetical protein [archaeon]MBT4461841.1 hypothetical protein [archaeon]MBT4857931.1 hypothetical protein [archaeon]